MGKRERDTSQQQRGVTQWVKQEERARHGWGLGPRRRSLRQGASPPRRQPQVRSTTQHKAQSAQAACRPVASERIRLEAGSSPLQVHEAHPGCC